MNNIEAYIDQIAEKFGYDEELVSQLKRVVPIMTEGKSEEVKNMLFDTLNRVKIFVMENDPTREDVEKCKQEVMGKDNKGVTFVEEDRGEYDNRGVAAGAYVNEPVFDEEMNIVGRNSFIYTTKLGKYSKLVGLYDTRINLGHLVRELGHAWASEKGEFVQNSDGSYVTNVGAYTSVSEVDKEKREVKQESRDRLMIEKNLNSIEEENVILKLAGMKNLEDLRYNYYYSPSEYQGMMNDMMRAYIEKFGKERFDKFRILKDREALKEIENALEDTEGWKTIQTEEYTEKKKAKFDKVNDLETTEGAKQIINRIVNEYSDDFFPDNTKFTPMQKLDNVFTQVYNFSTARYNFGILGNDHNMDIYKEIMTSIISEGYVLKNQARNLPNKEIKENHENSFMSELKGQIKSDKEIMSEQKETKSEPSLERKSIELEEI